MTPLFLIQNDGDDSGLLWTVLVVLVVICLLVWLFRNLR